MKRIKWVTELLGIIFDREPKTELEREMMIERREQLRRELGQDLRMERDEENKLNK
jgi:hypothetical protein